MMKIALALGLHETDLGTGIRDAIKKPVFDKLKQSPAVLVLVRVEAPFFTDREGVRECLADLSEIPGLALIVSMEGKVSPRGINWSPPMILPPLELEDARKVFLKVASDISPAAPFLDELLEETACIPLAVELIARVAKVHKFLELVLGLLKESKEVWAKEVWAELDAVIEVSINSPPMKDCPKRLLGLLAVLPDGIAVSDLEMLLPGCGIREEEHTLVGAGLAIEDEVDQHRRVYMRTPVRKSVMRQDPPLPLLADDLERAIKHYVELAATFGPMYGRKGGAAAVDRITPELANLEEMLLQGLDQPDPMPSIAAAQRVTDIILHSGRGTSRVLKKACEVAEKRGQKLDWADCCTRLGDIARFWSQHDSAQTWYGKALGLYEELEGCDLRLMSSVNDVNSIPTEGKNLIIVANVQDVLHFRAFAADGKRVVDTDESQLPDQAPQIAKLKTLLSGLWGVPELPQSDKAKVISAVTSIVGHTQDLEQTKLNDEKLKKTRCMHAYCVQMLGQVALLRSMYNPAIGNFTDAKKLYIELGDKNGVADCIKGLGDAVRERSDQSALQYYKEACDLSRQEGYDLGLANSTQGMADIYLAKGGKDEVRSASSYYERAEGLYRRVGDYLGLANCIKGKGDAALNLEQFDDAERFYKQAAEYYLSLKNAVCEANLHKAFGDLALARGPERYEEAADEYKQALNKYEGTGNIRGKALCTKSLAEVYLKKGDYHLSEELFDEAWKNFEELNIINQMAACIKQLGDIALKRDKDTEKARERYLKALPDYERVGDILGRAYCLNSLGDLALASEPPQDAEAKKYYGMASQLFQEKGQRDYEADTLLRLGEIGLKQGELDPAKDHLDKALSLYEELGHQNGEAHCVKSLAEVHLKKGDYNRSERLFEDARKRFDEMNIINQKAACIKQLGDIALKRDRDIGKARQRYLEALSLHEQAGDTEGSAYCVNSLGDLESACEPPHDADAKKYYEEASRLFHEKRNRDYEARTLLRLGEMELKEGDVDPARKHLRMALSLYRRVGDQTGIDNVQGLLTRIASGIAG